MENLKMEKGISILDREGNVIITFTKAEYTGWSETITTMSFGDGYKEEIAYIDKLVNEGRLKEFVIGTIEESIEIMLDETGSVDDVPNVYDLSSLKRKIEKLEDEKLEEIVRLQTEKEELEYGLSELNKRIQPEKGLIDHDFIEKCNNGEFADKIKELSLNQNLINFQMPQQPVLPITKDNK